MSNTDLELKSFLRATGLTESVVRHWIEQRLIPPSAYWSRQSGRRHRFNDFDVVLAKLLWRLHENCCGAAALRAVSDHLHRYPWMIDAEALAVHGSEVHVGPLEEVVRMVDKFDKTVLVARIRDDH